MALPLLSCALVFGCIFNVVSADCGALAVTKIADVLSTVADWKQLAGWLDVPYGQVEGINAKCLRESGDRLGCYNTNLVRVYCDSKGGAIQSIVEDIAQALETMNKNLQASKLRNLELGGQLDEDETGTCPRDDPDCDKPSVNKPQIVADDWQEQEPESNELEFFQYRDSAGKMKNFRLLQQIQGSWRSIGTQLEIETAVLNSFEKKHRGEVLDMCLEVFYYWSVQGLDKYPYTWGSVVKMLEVVQLKNIGNKLENALSNRV